MSEKRIPCINPNCVLTILQQTAELNDGRCGRCQRDFEHSEFEKQQTSLKELYRNTPPQNKEELKQILSKHKTEGNWFEMFLLSLLPTLIDYTKFSTKDFTKAVKTISQQNKDNLTEISGDFLYLCEPLLFKYDKLHKGLRQIPRPYRELTAAYQFRGIMEGDGISSYIEQVSKAFDSEAIRGFILLGLSDSANVVKESRKRWNKKEYEFEEGVEDGLEDRVYKEADDFEEKLGAFLLKLSNE